VNVRFLNAAEREALKAAFWYDDQRPGLGDEFLDEVDIAWKAIGEEPERHAAADLPRSKRDIRYFHLKRFPYVIYFEIRGDEILILAVAHTSRRPFYWKRRR
jgi:toxin ParE1/3/4